VLCGPGNNGGDGFVIARLLAGLGWQVEVFLYGDPAKLPPDARANHERWLAIGAVLPWEPEVIGAASPDLFVDAVFGAGLARAPEAKVMEPITELYVKGRTFDRMVAVDAPTGLCMDSGRPLSSEWGAVHAFLTVTFHRARIGHYLDEGPFYCGKVVTVPLGLCSGQQGQGPALVEAPSPPALGKDGARNKFGYGHAIVMAGPSGRGGAARLSARGALRIGAGLVTLGCPANAMAENAARLDAVMLRGIDDAGEFSALMGDPRINALCLGPGFGTDAREAGLIGAALQARRATILDADALTLVARDPALFAALHRDCVLTPHGGEFARLFPDIAERLASPATTGPAYSKVDATREAAARAGCVVLFKGPDTVIATPDGRCAINAAFYECAAPWLATAGSGDVLAGFITGLLARGFTPFEAACTGAWLHVEAARSFGPGLIAEDLPEELPKVFRALGL
ncbi:MAG: NAD(P)H-hydrate dehydratase, partial [Gemmobacter sp.]